MNCLNCEVEVTGNFCSNCAQRIDVKRITFREGWNDFWARGYGFDGMFPRTLRDLTIRPGFAARKYIDGNRVLYYGPVGYCFLMLTIYLLVASMLGVDLSEFMNADQKMYGANQSAEQQRMGQAISDFVSNNMKLLTFLIIPFTAFVSRFMLFRKSRLNFLEHTIIPFYLGGHLLWVSIVALVVYKFTGSTVLNSINLLVMLLCSGLAYSFLMDYQSRWKAFIKGMFVQLLSVLLLVILGVLATIILAVVRPDLFEGLIRAN